MLKRFLLFLLLPVACEPPPRPVATNETVVAAGDKFITSDHVSPDEEYVMVTTAVNLPFYVNNDQAAFRQWGLHRELFTWMGAEFLYSMRHKTVQISFDDARAGVIPIPSKVITGPVEVDASNADQFSQDLADRR